MTESKRPISITIIALVYLTVGIVGFVYHFKEIRAPDGIGIELTEFLAIVAGAFLLRGSNLARWLALAWMAFHVVLSFFHPLPELLIHCLFFAVFAWLLFRSPAATYFRANRPSSLASNRKL